MVWFWSIVWYSFVGFCLEVTYARATGGREGRKCLLVLPLCPVYGFGAAAILWLSPLAAGRIWALFLLGAAAATLVEYVMALWYELALGVQFWDYRGLFGNVQGRVCLPFSLVWGLLTLGLLPLHTYVAPLFAQIPLPVTLSMALLVLADGLTSSVTLRRQGREALCWWRAG